MVKISDLGIDQSKQLFDKNVDQKERLAQTYIVVYTLLLTCRSNENVPRSIIVGFLICIILYYVSLTLIPNSFIIILANIFAFISSIFFSYSFVLFLDNDPIMDIPTGLFILMLTGSVFASLMLFENFEDKKKLTKIIIYVVFLIVVSSFIKDTVEYVFKLVSILDGLF